MQQPHFPSREQSEASLARFDEHLGYQPPTPRFGSTPRLSGDPVHAHLSATVRRKRRTDPLPIRLRIARRRFTAGADRLFNAACTVAVAGIVGYVIAPAAIEAAARALS